MKNQILESKLLCDNITESVYEVLSEGSESQSMLLCEVTTQNGEKLQVHITVTRDEYDFIDNTEDMPVLSYQDGDLS